uniref:LigA n=1 Tax=Parastrongyloides trichosuri TaxID=131310 RepID=A0A0N4ZEB4_PARTI
MLKNECRSSRSASHVRFPGQRARSYRIRERGRRRLVRPLAQATERALRRDAVRQPRKHPVLHRPRRRRPLCRRQAAGLAAPRHGIRGSVGDDGGADGPALARADRNARDRAARAGRPQPPAGRRDRSPPRAVAQPGA